MSALENIGWGLLGVAVGVGGYFVWKNRDKIQEAVNAVVEKTRENDSDDADVEEIIEPEYAQ